MVGSLELVSPGAPAEMSEKQSRAWRLLARMLKRLRPQQRAVLQDVCCFEEGAESVAARLGWPSHVGLLMLRDALEALAHAPKRREYSHV